MNGLLLGKKANEKSKTEVVDAIPLFHQCLYVSPMSEIALVQVENRAANEGLQIIGYYAAPENFHANSIDKAPGMKMAEKIVENHGSSCVVVVSLSHILHRCRFSSNHSFQLDNKSICVDMKQAAMNAWQSSEGKWTKTKLTVSESRQTLEAVSLLLQRGAMKEIFDYDNHLDNVENDWTNQHLNVDLKQILSMH